MAYERRSKVFELGLRGAALVLIILTCLQRMASAGLPHVRTSAQAPKKVAALRLRGGAEAGQGAGAGAGALAGASDLVFQRRAGTVRSFLSSGQYRNSNLHAAVLCSLKEMNMGACNFAGAVPGALQVHGMARVYDTYASHLRATLLQAKARC